MCPQAGPADLDCLGWRPVFATAYLCGHGQLISLREFKSGTSLPDTCQVRCVFGIWNISDFRKIICHRYSALLNATGWVWGNILLSDTSRFLQQSLWILRHTGIKEVCRVLFESGESILGCWMTSQT